MDFGESGNNFIEIGKEPQVLKSMLGAALLLRYTEFRSAGETVQSADLEKQAEARQDTR